MSVKVGDMVFVRAIARGVWPDGSIVIAETRPIIKTVGEQLELLSKDVIPDSPALIPVARCLANPGFVDGLISLLEGVDWHYESTEAEQSGRMLLAALEEGTR